MTVDTLETVLERFGVRRRGPRASGLAGAVQAFEDTWGGWIGPTEDAGGPLHFSARGDELWVALGAATFASRGIESRAFPAGSVLVARLLPIAMWWDGPPVVVEAVDRAVVTGGYDDIAIDPSGAVLACGLSTGQRVVRVGEGAEAFVERLARVLAPPARGWSRTRLRISPRSAVTKLGLGQRPDVMVLDGDWLEPERDCALVVCEGVEAMTEIVARLGAAASEVQIARLEGRFDVTRVHPPASAPPARAPVVGDLVLAEGAVIQQRLRDDRADVIDRLDADGWRRDAYLCADDALAGVLSPRARAWLRDHGAMHDPARTSPVEELEALLAATDASAVAAALAFEQTFGALSVTDSSGEYWLGVGLSVRAGHRVANGRIPMGAFQGGIYRIDGRGRVWVDDSVMEPFVIASTARHLVERFAVGERYPESFFEWSGEYRVAIEDGVATELAARLGLDEIEELSDEVERVYAGDGVACWEPPAWAELSHPPAVAVCETAAQRDRVLDALRALGVEASVTKTSSPARSSLRQPEHVDRGGRGPA
jgi:hypothetical protein